MERHRGCQGEGGGRKEGWQDKREEEQCKDNGRTSKLK